MASDQSSRIEIFTTLHRANNRNIQQLSRFLLVQIDSKKSYISVLNPWTPFPTYTTYVCNHGTSSILVARDRQGLLCGESDISPLSPRRRRLVHNVQHANICRHCQCSTNKVLAPTVLSTSIDQHGQCRISTTCTIQRPRMDPRTRRLGA